jgi:hypothetical protein
MYLINLFNFLFKNKIEIEKLIKIKGKIDK